MMAHLPMLLHPNPQDTLVICFGMGTTYRSAVSHGGKVTAVELIKEVLDVFDHFHEDAEQVRAYPNGKMIVNDGRNFLKLTRNRFDVITLDPPPPIDAAGVNHLYSREFIELAKSRLKKGGIMAHWIPRPGTLSGVDDWKTFNMLVATFMDAFPYVYSQWAFHDIGLHILGSMEPITISSEQVRRRMDNGMIRKDIDEWDAVPFTYIMGMERKFDDLRSFPRITDDRPRLEFYLLTTWAEGGRKMQASTFW
jgi:spermidine synthase